MSSPKKSYTLVPPDGGWGWMVILGGAISAVSMSFGQGTSVLVMHTIDRYKTTTGQIGVLATIIVTVASFSGPVVSSLCTAYSPRRVGIFGSILLTVSSLIAFLGDSMLTMQLSKGIIGGIAFSCILNASIINVNLYFAKKRARVNCLMAATIGLGRIALAPVMFSLIDIYGYRGTLLLMGGFTLHGIIGASLYQPVKWHMIREPISADELSPETEDLIVKKNDETEEDTSTNFKSDLEKNAINEKFLSQKDEDQDRHNELIRQHSVLYGSTPGLQILGKENEEEVKKRSSLRDNQLIQILKNCVPDFSIMNNPIFLLLSYVSPMSILTMVCVGTYLPTLAAQNKFSQGQTAIVLSAVALSDTGIKVAGSFVLDKYKHRHKHIYFCAFVSAAINCIGLTFSREYWMFLTFVMLYGCSTGLANSLSLTLMANYLGAAAFANAFGLKQFIQGFLSLIVMSGIGFSRDATGDARVPYLIIIFLIFTIIFACCFEPYIVKKQNDNNNK